ncbi:SMI1/KNR4 family protein [Tateyamaria armeniaca]|uniref:SMI1/KNR4 family protein n=1 Tax=Tateyamaria armeniaca TaxID=2518930 RepID=A0ABW8USP5_9RHOB
MASFDELVTLIEENRSNGVEFGTQEQDPGLPWIEKAESALGCSLPPSYKWFLQNFGGGEIYGEEIYSVYPIEPYGQVPGGDVTFNTLNNRRNGFLKENQLAVSASDAGELFYLDMSHVDADGEAKVIRKTGDRTETYAANFAEFLKKRIAS